MKNIPDIKLGIVVGTTDWLPADVASAQRIMLVEACRTIWSEDVIYECPVVISDNEVSVKRAMKDILKAECNAVCIYYANYGPESAGTLFAKEFDGPVMLFAAADEGDDFVGRERKDAMSGFINACYALKLRRTNVYVPARPVGNLTECVEMIREFIPVARTLVAVRDLKLIAFGPRPSSYLASSAPNHLLYDLGIEIAEYSELELLDSFRKHEGDARIEKLAGEMAQELGEKGNRYPASLPRFAQYELTVEDWVRNHKGNKKFITLTSTCWPAFPVNFGFVPCYVNSRLTGKGMPVACEVDAFGAVSEYIGQCVSDDVVTILNLNNNIPQTIYDEAIKGQKFNGREYTREDLFLGYHCGVTCSAKLTSSTSALHFVNNQLIGEDQSKGTIQGDIVPGAITLFRLQGSREGRLQAYICQGQILPVSAKTYGGQGIIAVSGFSRFLRSVVLEKQFPNHAAIVFGHYGKELFGILRQLGIEDIEYNHPAHIPYQGENVFATNENWF